MGFVDGEISDLVFELKEALSVLVAVVVVEVEVLGLVPELEEGCIFADKEVLGIVAKLEEVLDVEALGLVGELEGVDCAPSDEKNLSLLAKFEEEVLSLSSQAEGESFILIEDENLGCLSLKFEETGFVLIDGEVLCLVPEVEEVG